MAGERFFRLGDSIIIVRRDSDDQVPDDAVEIDPVDGKTEIEALTGTPVEVISGNHP